MNIRHTIVAGAAALLTSWSAYALPTGAPGDFDGDAKSDMAQYKANGDWTILKSTDAFATSLVKSWGGVGYTPVTGDYDGDGRPDLAVYCWLTGEWLLRPSGATRTTTLRRSSGGAGEA